MPVFMVALAAVTWGTTGTTLKLIGGEASPLLVGAIRMLVAGPTLFLAVAATGQRARWTWSLLAPGVCVASYQLTYFSAVPRAGVAATALLAICSAPLMIVILEWILLRQAISPGKAVALGLGTAGAALLLAGAGVHAGPDFVLGAVLALGAGLSYSLYAVLTKRAIYSQPPLALAAVTFSAAAILLSPFLLANVGDSVALVARAPLHLLYLGVVVTGLAYGLYTTALRHIAASSAAVAGLMEPLTAALLGMLLFREDLGALGAIGGVLMIMGVAALNSRPRRWPFSLAGTNLPGAPAPE